VIRHIKLWIEYDGTHFAGWQTQPQKRTVQETLEKILSQITQEKIHVIGASRTDAGVHALGQVANFETRSPPSCEKLLVALNGLLPEDISILKVQEVSSGFHANKKAKRKTYEYLIWNSRVRSALLKDRAWHLWMPLHLKDMRLAAKYLIGKHDFSAFRGSNSRTRTSVRIIEKITIYRKKTSQNSLIQIQITGNGFLKYMVRNIVGTLAQAGKKKLTPEDVKRILQSKDRRKAAMAAPACGLYLKGIRYSA